MVGCPQQPPGRTLGVTYQCHCRHGPAPQTTARSRALPQRIPPRRQRLGNINGILGPAGTGGPTRGHATARMNTLSRQNAGDREGHVAAWGGPDAVGRGATSGGAGAPRRSPAKRWGRVARVGRDVGDEVSGGARRGPGGGGIGPLGREPEMGEDPADHPGILNGRDQAHAPPTAHPCQRGCRRAGDGRLSLLAGRLNAARHHRSGLPCNRMPRARST